MQVTVYALFFLDQAQPQVFPLEFHHRFRPLPDLLFEIFLILCNGLDKAVELARQQSELVTAAFREPCFRVPAFKPSHDFDSLFQGFNDHRIAQDDQRDRHEENHDAFQENNIFHSLHGGCHQ